MEDPEFADFWQLLGYHDVITPEIQRMALAAEVFWPCEIYYHAPADVGEGLIHALLSTEDSSEASNLMCWIRFFCFAAICSGVQANAVFRSCSHLHFQHNPS